MNINLTTLAVITILEIRFQKVYTKSMNGEMEGPVPSQNPNSDEPGQKIVIPHIENPGNIGSNMIQCKSREALSSEGFADEVIHKLQAVRDIYQAEKTPEIKRLEFARWMYVHDKIGI